MKFKLDKPKIIKLLIILALLYIAPFAVPFMFEFVLMADILGLEALILFLLFQSKGVLTAFPVWISNWTEHAVATLLLLANFYIFQPRVLLSHVAGSSLILMFACSIAMALAIWVPAIYLSGGGFT